MVDPIQNPYNVNQGGNGMYRRTRLDPNTFNGANDAPVTQGQMREFMRVLRDWSESLPFARVGFQVSGLTAYVDVPLGDSIITWEQVISDSSTWTKMDKNEDNLTEFTVPPGEGGMYSISWALNCLVVDVGEDLFGPVNDVQSWEVPPDVISVDIECVGATGQGTNFGAGGQGALIAGTLAVTPGDFYDVYVPGSDAWPGAGPGPVYPDAGRGSYGGFDVNSRGGNGGGSARVTVAGDPFNTPVICAGGGGGGNAGSMTGGRTGGHGGDMDGTNGASATTGAEGGGGTQTTGGAAGAGGTTGTTAGTQTAGGNGGTGANPFPGGGGGGGGYWGGGGGDSSNLGGGSGGGGSSFLDPALTDTIVNGTYNVANSGIVGGQRPGYVLFSWITEFSLAANTVYGRVIHVPKQPPDGAPYSQEYLVSEDRGYSPLHGSVLYPLQEGDRLYVEINNAGSSDGQVVYRGLASRLSAFRTGF